MFDNYTMELKNITKRKPRNEKRGKEFKNILGLMKTIKK